MEHRPFLRCLGKPRLESGSSLLTEPQPLVLLAYMALEGKTLRSELADLFWVRKAERELRFKSLSSALSRLREAAPGAVALRGKKHVDVSVDTDVAAFKDAVNQGDFERAVALYAGPFLEGVERDKRFSLGEELEEWVLNTRENVQARYLESLLALGERQARQERFAEAADLAWRAFALDKAVSYPHHEEYQRIHLLLLAAGRAQDAKQAAAEGRRVWEGEAELVFAADQQDARARLTFTRHLPAVSSTFVGREQELERLEGWLTASPAQLVTVTGVGGVGKTELAVRLVRTLVSRFRDGLFYIPLETLPPQSGLEGFLGRVARGLGLEDAAGAPAAAVQAFLGAKHALLVLDNMEHLRRHGAAVARLLAACPELRILVTSRERLNLDEEQVLELRGLPCRGDTGGGGLELFRRRAGLLGLELGERAERDAARAVELVEGHPLAIKLTASWLTSVTPSDIARQLEAGLALLTDGPVDDAERHRSIRAAFDFSYELLSQEERRAFARLAVFAGSFTLDAAAEVAGATAAHLRGLVDKSLLRFVHGLYSLHPLLRHYAQGLGGVGGELRDAHARYFLNELRRMTDAPPEARLEAPKQLDEVAPELFAAWRWACDQGWDALVGDAALPLMLFGNATSRMRETGGALEAALARFADQDGAFRGRLASSLAWCHLRLSDYPQAVRTAQASLEQLGEAGPALPRSNSLLALAGAQRELGAFAAAQAAYRRALALHPEGGSEWANVLCSLAGVAMDLGDYAQATRDLGQTHAAFRAKRHRAGLVWVSVLRGRSFLEEGSPLEARALLETALAEAEAGGQVQYQLVIRSHLAAAHLALEQHDQAEACSRALRDFAARGGNAWRESVALLLGSQAALARRDLPEARARILESLRVAQFIENVPGKLQQLIQVLRLDLECASDPERLERLCGFLAQPEQLARMCHADRRQLGGLMERCGARLPGPPEAASPWSALSVQEVCQLVTVLET